MRSIKKINIGVLQINLLFKINKNKYELKSIRININ